MPTITECLGKNFQLHHAIDNPPKMKDYFMHMHDNYEIFCFVSGNAHYMVEGTVYELFPGSLLLMRQSESHTLILDGFERYERFTLNFRYELFEHSVFLLHFCAHFMTDLSESAIYIYRAISAVSIPCPTFVRSAKNRSSFQKRKFFLPIFPRCYARSMSPSSEMKKVYPRKTPRSATKSSNTSMKICFPSFLCKRFPSIST